MKYTHLEKAKAWIDLNPNEHKNSLASIAHGVIAIAEINEARHRSQIRTEEFLHAIAEQLEKNNRDTLVTKWELGGRKYTETTFLEDK